jgi:hypothetical protein
MGNIYILVIRNISLSACIVIWPIDALYDGCGIDWVVTIERSCQLVLWRKSVKLFQHQTMQATPDSSTRVYELVILKMLTFFSGTSTAG